MNAHATAVATYGEMIEPTTLKIQRMLPGSVERVWDYLTKSELRRQWFAAGDMEMKAGTTVELVWRNNELTNPPGKLPDGFNGNHTMTSTIIACDPPRKLAFTWGMGGTGDVTFTLEPRGDRTLLTVVHTGLVDPNVRGKVGPGWHAHIDVLASRMAGTEPAPFWDNWTRLKADYDKRL
ncbi:MAG TPA: SRPBCC family protein [Pseudolabrys sp.]|nr:SRPBCC family protein [Pseudolabrys sp.]